MSAAWLILPTYNEADNLEPMVEAVLPQHGVRDRGARACSWSTTAHPTAPGEIADRLAARIPELEVLHRAKKEGLGRAYLAGFGHALAGGADLLVQMDCDFSHDPADLPRLIAAAETSDLVLGSRYVPGGGVTNWALSRRMLSRGGCAYARLILGVPVRDLTGGFKCWRRPTLEQLDLAGVDAHGYGFQIEMTYRAIRAGMTVTEVPILFRERREGQSKMDTWITLEAVWKVPVLRFRA